MRMLVAFVLLVASAGCTERQPDAFPAPAILVGMFESETLSAEDRSSTSFEVSHACGAAEAIFRVDRVLFGNHRGSRGVLRYGIGEWCEPELFPARAPVLLCVSQLTEGEHRFRSEPIYPTVEGDAIVPLDTLHIGNLDLEPLFRPLPEAIRYAALSDVDPEHMDTLVAKGLVTSDGLTVFATHGVFLDDLTRSIGSGQWQPRVFTIAPDGTGGYVELPEDSPDLEEASTGAPTGQGSHRFLEC